MFTDIAFLCMIMAFLCVLYKMIWHIRHGQSDHAIMSHFCHRIIPFLQFGFCSISLGLVIYSFIQSDMSVDLVRGYSHITDPLWIRMTAVWASHQGSLLLLLWYLSALFFMDSLSLKKRFSGHVQSLVFSMILLSMMVGIVWFFNPFTRSMATILDGASLNPLLQDISMVIHPPILLFSYALSAWIFARFLGAVLYNIASRNHDNAFWQISCFTHDMIGLLRTYWWFSGLAIMLGSFWAFYELGWGGFWFWDPVENISILPWLMASMSLHLAAILHKNDHDNILIQKALFLIFSILCLGLWPLILAGSGIIRSGILGSVHSFANAPDKSLFFLGFSFACITIAIFTLWPLLKQFSMPKTIKNNNHQHPKQKMMPPLPTLWMLMGSFWLCIVFVLLLCSAALPVLSYALYGQTIQIAEAWFQIFMPPLLWITLVNMIGVLWPFMTRCTYRMHLLHHGSIQVLLLILGFTLPPIWLLSILVIVCVIAALYLVYILASKQKRPILKTPQIIVHILHIGIMGMAIAMTSSTLLTTEKEMILDTQRTYNTIDFSTEPHDAAWVDIVPKPLRPNTHFIVSNVENYWGKNYRAHSVDIWQKPDIGSHNLYPPIARAALYHYVVQDTTTAEIGLYHDAIYTYYIILQQYPDGYFGVTIKIMPLAGWIWVFEILILLSHLTLIIIMIKKPSPPLKTIDAKLKTHDEPPASMSKKAVLFSTILWLAASGAVITSSMPIIKTHIPTVHRYGEKPSDPQTVQRLIQKLTQAQNQLAQTSPADIESRLGLWRQMTLLYWMLGDYENAALSALEVKKLLKQTKE